MFDHILNWKLLEGSHDFPGPDGGTCVNEAAVVAAGFRYRKVQCADDCPPCFSRPISAYAISLNDQMPNSLRQKLLMPFVIRLAGTADTPEIEYARVKLMIIQTVKKIIPISLQSCGLLQNAQECGQVTDLKSASDAAYAARSAAYAASDAAYAARSAAYAASDAVNAAYAARSAAYAARSAAYAARSAASDVKTTIFSLAVSILDEAINLGKQGDLVIELASQRLENTKKNSLVAI